MCGCIWLRNGIKEDFAQHLFKIIDKTIEIYLKRYPEIDKKEKFAFYKSQIRVEELLRYRIFASSGYRFDVANIQMVFNQNPNNIMPIEMTLISSNLFLMN